MGSSSNKEQKIELHVNINMNENGVPSQKKTVSVNSNNPSAVINISGLNNEITETTETSQTNPTNKSVKNSQNNGNNQIVKNIQNKDNNSINENKENNENNENNDAAPPMPFAGYQNSSINSSTSQQFDINVGGTDNQTVGEDKKFTNTNERTIYDKPTDQGNIDMNIGGGIRVEQENKTDGKPTDKGNIDMNIAGGIRVEQENKTPNETPYSKPINTANIGYISKNDLGNNDPDDPLGFSRNIYVGDKSDIDGKKELINKRVEEGYFPLFIQLDKEKALFFFIKKYVTIKNALEEYKNLIGINGYNKEYTLYNKQTKKLVPQDVPIEDLDFNYFTYISNNI